MSERPTRTGREGSLEAPTRHALDWQNPAFWDEAALERELERVFDICHGCRRCFNLCNAFPVLFDHVDASPTGEVASMPREAGWEVVDPTALAGRRSTGSSPCDRSRSPSRCPSRRGATSWSLRSATTR
mgnify:CR=1 FL=1